MAQWLISRLGDGGEQDFLLADVYARRWAASTTPVELSANCRRGQGVDFDNLDAAFAEFAYAVAGRELEQQGLVACNQALDLKKHAADVLDSRGLIDFQTPGRFKDALADYDAALDENSRMNSSRYRARRREAFVLGGQGRRAEGHRRPRNYARCHRRAGNGTSRRGAVD